MPAIGFVCPDGSFTPFQVCLQRCPFANKFEAERCLSIRTLSAIAEQREWTGVPSTTQLLKGTREVYLEITEDYFVDPQNRIAALAGTRVHSVLDKFSPTHSVTERRLFDEIGSGQLDFYMDGVLFDNKNYGSYKAASVLGIKDKYVFDGYYKTGEKKGQPKYKKELVYDGTKSRLDLAIQLNHYRMLLEANGYPVKKLVCEMFVRDGGTYLAKQRGIDFNARLIIINKLSDIWVHRYLMKKANLLKSALETRTLPAPCRYRENWNEKKCSLGWCSVREFCDIGYKYLSIWEVDS